MIDKHTSETFWGVKAFAIFTIFYAHLVWTGDSLVGKTVYESIGCIGVPLFMLMAGYFDAKSTSSLKRKVSRLFVPLLVWGTVTYCIKMALSPIPLYTVPFDWFKWVYGCGTWYYFIPVLFWCQLLSKYINNLLLAVIGLISMVLTHIDIIPYNELFTPYTNPFNLIVYFIAGRIFREKRGDNVHFHKSLVILSPIVIIAFLSVFYIPYYWNVLSVIYAIALFIMVWTILNNTSVVNKTLVKLGKISMVVYLFHMQIAQGLSNQLYSLTGGGNLSNIIKVPVAFIFVIAFVLILEWFLKKAKHEKALSWLGYR